MICVSNFNNDELSTFFFFPGGIPEQRSVSLELFCPVDVGLFRLMGIF